MNAKTLGGILKAVKDKGNPKCELDGVFIDGNKLVCTNTNHLLILEFKESFTESNDEQVIIFESNLPKSLKFDRAKEAGMICDANERG